MRIECFSKSKAHDHDAPSISLDFESRTRSRGKALASDGNEVAWFFEQGEFLRDGDVLSADNGSVYRVEASPEPVSQVTSDDHWLLMRVAYHLGNRHVSLAVKHDQLLYQPDYVLDDMVRGLGAAVTLKELPFQPEDGAYHSHGDSHEHGNSHERVDSHEHGNSHERVDSHEHQL